MSQIAYVLCMSRFLILRMMKSDEKCLRISSHISLRITITFLRRVPRKFLGKFLRTLLHKFLRKFLCAFHALSQGIYVTAVRPDPGT